MGFLDIFGGGTPAEKANKLKAKVTQKYGDPATRQKALSQLGEMKTPEAIGVLMHRFTITVDPHTTDADEKEQAFEYICSLEKDSVAPVKEFLKRSDQASSWAVKVLERVLPEAEATTIFVDELKRLAAEYSRDPQKKIVLLQHVEPREDPRVPEVATALLEDHSDDVKVAALLTLARRKHEPAREPMLKLLTAEDTAKRVQTAAIEAIAQCEFPVTGYREKVEARLSDPWSVDRAGHLKKRG